MTEGGGGGEWWLGVECDGGGGGKWWLGVECDGEGDKDTPAYGVRTVTAQGYTCLWCKDSHCTRIHLLMV